MQGGAHRHLHRFEVQTLAVTPLAENHLEQTIYFLGHFPVERLGRFFLLAEHRFALHGAQPTNFLIHLHQPPSQRLKPVELAHLALRKAAGLEEVSESVLPHSLRVSRKFDPWPGCAGWWRRQLALPRWPMMLVIEPRRKSPKPAIFSTT
jgi:hypothetical protein